MQMMMTRSNRTRSSIVALRIILLAAAMRRLMIHSTKTRDRDRVDQPAAEEVDPIGGPSVSGERKCGAQKPSRNPQRKLRKFQTMSFRFLLRGFLRRLLNSRRFLRGGPFLN